MSNYPKADKTTQWFADDFEGDRLELSADTFVGVIHTTETIGWPGYNGGATAPNYTGHPPLKGISPGQWRAHFPDEMSSRALRNQAGGVETNTLNAVQFELIGTCDPKHAKSWNGQGRYIAGKHYVYWPNATDAQLKWLAGIMADMHVRHGAKFVAPAFWAYPRSYGATSNRFTFSEWRNFAGWCGHQHVPENAHGDPGSLNVARAITFAKAMVAPAKPRWVDFSMGHWNVQNSPNVEADIRGVKKIAAQWPNVIHLCEAGRLYGKLKIPGYTTYQDASGPPSGKQDEHSNCAILVRYDLEVEEHIVGQMTKSWKGPKLGLEHEPRRYKGVWVNKGGVLFKFAGVHLPFPKGGSAVAESVAWCIDYLRDAKAVRPVALVGDFQWRDVAAKIAASYKGAKMIGAGIDLLIIRGCVFLKGINLGKLGSSDHDAKIFTIRKYL